MRVCTGFPVDLSSALSECIPRCYSVFSWRGRCRLFSESHRIRGYQARSLSSLREGPEHMFCEVIYLFFFSQIIVSYYSYIIDHSMFVKPQ